MTKRLEEIKKNIKMHMEWAKGTHYAEITEEELKDYEWLIKQAEHVEELKKQSPGIELNMLNDEVVRLEKQNKRYKQALEFYANEIQYEWVENYDGEKEFCIEADGGEKARQALESEKNG